MKTINDLKELKVKPEDWVNVVKRLLYKHFSPTTDSDFAIGGRKFNSVSQGNIGKRKFVY